MTILRLVMNFQPPNVWRISVSNGISMTADQQDRDDGRLVKAVLRGELAAFEVLVGRYQRQGRIEGASADIPRLRAALGARGELAPEC